MKRFRDRIIVLTGVVLLWGWGCASAIWLANKAVSAPTNIISTQRVDLPSPSPNLDAPERDWAKEVGVTNTNAIVLQSSLTNPPSPPAPTFVDGVLYGARATRRNPDVVDLATLSRIAYGMWAQEHLNK